MAQTTQSPLHQAAAAGDIRRVRELLNKGADVNAKWTFEAGADRDPHLVSFTRAPLFLAIDCGHGEIASLLIDRGARVDMEDDYSRITPLTLAALGGLSGVVAKIVARGPQLSDLDSALVRACGGVRSGETMAPGDVPEEERERVVRILLDAGARSPEALWQAAFRGRINLAALLVDAGVPFEYDDDDEDTRSALSAAVAGGHLAMFEWLEARGADPTAILDDALGQAADDGDPAMVEEMLQRGAAVDAQDEDGWTALFNAVNRGHREVVDLLLRNGADRSIQDYEGKTARDWAKDASTAALVA